MERSAVPVCDQCNLPVTVSHILIDCSKYSEKRNEYFQPLVQQGLTLNLLLAESDTFSIDRIIKFLTDIDILNHI